MALDSFDDIRSAVRTALQAVDPDKGADLCVCDLGSDWVVYQDPDATPKPGLFRRGYHLSGDRAILDSKPVAVARVTTYEPVNADDQPAPKNVHDAGKQAYRLVRDSKRSAQTDAS